MKLKLMVAMILCVGSCLVIGAQQTGEAQDAALRALVSEAPRLALKGGQIPVVAPSEGWELGMVSWLAMDEKNGIVYLLQRGDKADPVVAVNREGRVLRQWGKGMFVMPHAIRIDPQGNIWTTDAASSMVLKFTPEGKKLMEISVGGQPSPCRNNFCGTTDVAFAPNGHIYISDGYGNARVLEYSADGKKIREWGTHGTGPGEFHLVHSVQVDENGIVYVADRENGRIQRFDLEGKYIGEWDDLGKPFSMVLRGGAIYVATQPKNQPNGAPGWLLKVDRKTGKILGYVDSTWNHGMEATESGVLLVGPGPGFGKPSQPQWFR